MAPPWGTERQRTFLRSKRPLYRKHQAEGTIPFFWPDLFDAWFQQFPDRTYDDGKNYETRLRSWYHNHGHQTDGDDELVVEAATSTRQGLLNLGRRDRKLTRLQMYQKRYYKPKWKAICGQKWREYQANLKDEEDDGLEVKARIAFVNELCTKFLEDESEEVKKEIDTLMARQAKGEIFLQNESEMDVDEDVGEEELDEKRKAIATTLVQWNKNIAKLPRTVSQVLSELRQKTGFVGTLLIGGPNPGDDGRIVSMCIDSEVGKDKNTFQKRYPAYSSAIEEPFVKYLHEVFSPEDRNRRSISRLSQNSSAMTKGLDVNMAPELSASRDKETAGPEPTEPLKIGPPKGKKKTPPTKTTDKSRDTEPEPPVSDSNDASKVNPSTGKGRESADEHPGISDARWASRPRNRAEVLTTVVRRPPPPWVDPDRWYAALNEPDDPLDSTSTRPTPRDGRSVDTSARILEPNVEKEVSGASQDGPGSTHQVETKDPQLSPAQSANASDPTPHAPGETRPHTDALNPSSTAADPTPPSPSPAQTAVPSVSVTDPEVRASTAAAHPCAPAPADVSSASADGNGSIPGTARIAPSTIVSSAPSTGDSAQAGVEPANTDEVQGRHIATSTPASTATTTTPTATTAPTSLNSDRGPDVTTLTNPEPDRPALTPSSTPIASTCPDPTQTSVDSNLVPDGIALANRQLDDPAMASSDQPITSTHRNPFLPPMNEPEERYVTEVVRYLEGIAGDQERKLPHLKLEDLKDDVEVMVNLWAGTERSMGYPGPTAKGHKIGTQDRPEQVGWWLARGRKIEKPPSIDDVEEYGEQMRKWWSGLQPEWRRVGRDGPWPLSRYAPADEDWDSLAKGGANGLAPFVIALGWWLESVEEEKAVRELASVVEDITWVLKEIGAAMEDGRVIDVLTRRGGIPKRGRDVEEGEKGRNEKKRRTGRK